MPRHFARVHALTCWYSRGWKSAHHRARSAPHSRALPILSCRLVFCSESPRPSSKLLDDPHILISLCPAGIPEQINLQYASADTVVAAFVTYEAKPPAVRCKCLCYPLLLGCHIGWVGVCVSACAERLCAHVCECGSVWVCR